LILQALILAAGLGQRLGDLTRNSTKAMIEVDGRTLIGRALDALAEAGVGEAAIVTGHAGDTLRAFVGDRHRGMRITYFENPIYQTTNNIYSLWLAREFLKRDDTVLLESDIVFEPRLLDGMLRNPHPNLAAVAKFEPWMDGTVTLLDAEDHIVGIVPKEVFDWRETERYYKTVNIYKFSKEFSRRFYLPFLDAYIEAFGRSRYYEQVLTVITYLSQAELRAFRVTDEKWYEIDDPLDLDIARTLFARGDESVALYERRYGGYWRFPKIRDFCYLVNPYFPGERLLDELGANARRLVTAYPSGQQVQSLLAAQLVGCDAAEVVVGNGASELITVLARELPGPFGLVVPGFEEYARAMHGHAEIARLVPRSPDFACTVSEFEEHASRLGTLVLCNPDNPSGHFLDPGSVIELLERLDASGTHVVLDESFVDFAGEPEECSVLRPDVLRRFPRLLVVKSISKSYGVPGLRLGVAASADRGLITRLASALPIWNINSMAESFLQVVGKHKREYTEACRRVAEDRREMHAELSAIPHLRVLPSRANFFLCELTSGMSARELTRLLLENNGIFIKDCSKKTGLGHGQFVRLAVRSRGENRDLVRALRASLRSA
jgi:histidinol-phosphate/aromatic aminotransferase/cobyric acid decarboxylase-like protein/choline kinase